MAALSGGSGSARAGLSREAGSHDRRLSAGRRHRPSARRSPALADLPAVAESGVPGYEASTWYGVLAPARTPASAVERLHGDIVKILAQPEFRERLQAQGFDPVGSSPGEFRAFIRSEIAKWGKVVRDAGIRAE